MKIKEWQQIEDLFHAALELEAEGRRVYLTAACAGDESLRAEVESLLRAFENREGFLGEPALSLGLKVLSGGGAGALAGRSIGQYKILRLLGAGGMGEVYLAEDCKLERHVALKFISGALVEGAWAKEQLTREARAAAKLDAPDICAVHGIEEIDGHSFIVMQYVEGETLDALAARRRPGAERVIGLAEQIAGALAAAHARGLVHRDIKPTNIMVTPGGRVKVLDFGLARLSLQGRPAGAPAVAGAVADSEAGLLAGTIAYMSPEQARGEALDARSDIFSLGLVLYELLCGTNPFRRDDAERTLEAIKGAAPAPPLAGNTPGVPAVLDRVVRKCLEKERDQRYQTTEELLQDLWGLRRARRMGRYAMPALALAMLLAAAAGFVHLRYNQTHTLAVLPCFDASGYRDAEIFCSGLTESLAGRLAHLHRLHVRAPTAFYKEQGADPAGVGRRLRADAVLVNELVLRDGSLQLHTTLLRAADGSPLWEETSPLYMDRIQSSLQDKIALRTAAGLRMWLSDEERQALTRHETDNPEAFRLYTHGQYLWDMRDKEKLAQAIKLFEKATALDPAYAKAWAGLACSYAFQTNVAFGPMDPKERVVRARAAANKALQIDSMISEAHTALGVLLLNDDWNWAGAEAKFQLAIRLNHDYAPAHYWYSRLLRTLGRNEEAIRESEVYKTLQPFAPLATVNLALSHYKAHDYDKALGYLKQVLDEDPNHQGALYMLGLVLVKKVMYPEAIETLERLSSINHVYAAAPLGYAYARAGRPAEAQRILAKLDEEPPDKPVPAQEKAIIYMGLRDYDKAFALFEESYKERFASLPPLLHDPFFDELRSDPRYFDLARRIGLNP